MLKKNVLFFIFYHFNKKRKVKIFEEKEYIRMMKTQV